MDLIIHTTLTHDFAENASATMSMSREKTPDADTLLYHIKKYKQRKEVEKMFTEAREFMGGIDILVTSAGGYTVYDKFEDITEDEWDRIIELNLKSVFLCCRAVIHGGWA